MSIIQRDNDIFRMERSVITNQNIDTLKEITGDRIAESLLYYICYEHQFNIFGYGHLDPEEFGNKYGFSREYMSKKHEHPYQDQFLSKKEKENRDKHLYSKRGKNEQATHYFIDRLENALFTLANLPINVMTTLVDDEKRLVRKYQPIRVLSALFIEQDKVSGKITFTYKLEESFRRNLSTYYLKSSTTSLIKLRKSGYGPIYQHILRLRDAVFAEDRTSTTPENTPQFAYLVELAKINKDQEPKYQKRKLNEVFEKINKETELEFDIEWIRGFGEKEKYTPIFHFHPRLGEDIGMGDRYKQTVRFNEASDVLITEFIHNLYEECPYNDYEHYTEAEKYFFKWIGNDQNPEWRQKIELLLSMSYTNAGWYIPEDIAKRAQKFIHMAKEKNMDEFEDWIRSILVPNAKYKENTINK